MSYDDIVVGATGTGIARATFGLPVKAAIDDIDVRINAFEGGTKMKSGTTSFASQTTLQNDPDLVFDIAPNTLYKVEWKFFHNAPAAADIKFAWTGMTWANVSGYFSYQGVGVSTPTPVGWVSAATAINFASTGGGSVDMYEGSGGLVSTTGGTIRPQYAQQVSNATNLNVYLTSFMTVTRVAIL